MSWMEMGTGVLEEGGIKRVYLGSPNERSKKTNKNKMKKCWLKKYQEASSLQIMNISLLFFVQSSIPWLIFTYLPMTKII